VYENRMLKKIFRPKRDEVIDFGENCTMRRFMYTSSSRPIIRMIKSRTMKWARHVARKGDERNAYRVLVGTPYGKRPLGSGEDKIDLRKIG
jgi:hypothetical protein